MEQILLTRAVANDAQDIYDVTKRSFKRYAEELGKSQHVTALQETLDDVKSDISTKYVFVAKLDGIIVGSVRFSLLSDGLAYLSRFAMNPDIQNLGLGGLLLEKVRLECLNLNVKAITLHTASKMRSSVAFYLKNGYYVHSISKDREYIRAFMVNELYPMDEMFPYEEVINKNT